MIANGARRMDMSANMLIEHGLIPGQTLCPDEPGMENSSSIIPDTQRMNPNCPCQARTCPLHGFLVSLESSTMRNAASASGLRPRTTMATGSPPCLPTASSACGPWSICGRTRSQRTTGRKVLSIGLDEESGDCVTFLADRAAGLEPNPSKHDARFTVGL